jgi:hypothetical protein
VDADDEKRSTGGVLVIIKITHLTAIRANADFARHSEPDARAGDFMRVNLGRAAFLLANNVAIAKSEWGSYWSQIVYTDGMI